VATELKTLREKEALWGKEKDTHIKAIKVVEKLKSAVTQLKAGSEKLEVKVELQGQAICPYAQVAKACGPIILHAIKSKYIHYFKSDRVKELEIKERATIVALKEYKEIF
jgi:hypothetical protein